MSFAAGGKKGSVRSDINITPLVDVVLVLLIIFMVATPKVLKELDVNVPQKADVETNVPPPTVTEQIVLKVDKQNNVSINTEAVSRNTLGQKVHTIFDNRREKLMFFDVDDEANYGEVVKIMDECRGAGVTTLGIMTRT